MKNCLLSLVMLICALPGNAQFLRSSTSVETSVFSFGSDSVKNSCFDHTLVDQTIYWRNRYNGEGQERTIYLFSGAFKHDSIIGLRVYGLDIDMMSEKFDNRKANTFRYWNKIRMGFALLIQKDLDTPGYPVASSYNYLDGEFFLSYLHLAHTARGDRQTRSRKGSFMAYFLITPTRRIETYAKFNIGSVWIKGYFYQLHGDFALSGANNPRVGILAEWEANPRGYDKTRVESSKDLYRGITLMGGAEYLINTSQIAIRIGMKIDLRNHG